MQCLYQGKTKNIFECEDGNILLKFKDDLTGVDGKFDPGANHVGLSIEGMGRLNLAMSAYFFNLLNDKKIPTHFIKADIDENLMKVKKAKLFGFGLEVITRFRAVGSFYRRYSSYIKQGDKLDNYFEITIKDDDKEDPIITKEALIALKIMTNEQYHALMKLNLKIANIIKDEMSEHNLDLYDIKLEFGTDLQNGEIMLIDEISGGNMRVYKKDRYLEPTTLSKIFIKEKYE